MSLRDQIFDSQDLPRKGVPCPEWGCALFVRSLTGLERVQYEDWLEATKDRAKIEGLARLVVLCAEDEAGGRVFQEGDEKALLAKNSAVLLRLFDAAAELNVLSAAAVEGMEKNSPGTTGAAVT